MTTLFKKLRRLKRLIEFAIGAQICKRKKEHKYRYAGMGIEVCNRCGIDLEDLPTNSGYKLTHWQEIKG